MKFIDGLSVKKPVEQAPSFVIAKCSMLKPKLVEWLQQQDGDWINFDLMESKVGKFYFAVDEYKPKTEQNIPEPVIDNGVPF
jgi:hypothetical protein